MKKQYTDTNGVKRVSHVPTLDTPAEEGIPASLELESLLDTHGVPQPTLDALYREFQARSLVETEDFLHPQAPELIRAALISVYRLDTATIIELARSQKWSHSK